MSSTAYISGLCPVPFLGPVITTDTCQIDSSIVVKMGANMSSGHITGVCATPVRKFTEANQCVTTSMPPMKSVQVPSMLLLASQCSVPTATQFAKFPKVAVPCSVRTENLKNPTCPTLVSPKSRFQQYVRYQPPVPCAPLPQSAQMAGKSQGSTRLCNPYPPT